MPANRFSIEGQRVDSLDEFIRLEADGGWQDLLYYPEKFESEAREPLVFKDKVLTNISFKDTDFKNIRFVNCTFRGCIFIGGSFRECEFTDCKFYDTNTSKVKIVSCLLDPISFADNFDLVDDTNIAIGLYQSLYRNATETHQPEHAFESLYLMKQAEDAHLDSKLKRGKLTLREYRQRKARYWLADFVSGHGFRTWKVFRLLGMVIGLFSLSNYLGREFFFKNGDSITLIDSIYFTCITITTLGYGDIVPTTWAGKLFVILQVFTGFMVISLFLAAVTNRALRAR